MNIHIADGRELDWPNASTDSIEYESQLKIRRVLTFARNFSAVVRKFENSDFYGMTPAVAPDGRHILQFKIDPLPEEVPILIGEIVHGLRSSLDVLWSAMTRRLGLSDKNVYFPVRKTEAEQRGVISVDPVAIAVPAVGSIIVDKHRLYQVGRSPCPLVHHVNLLDRADKHQLLVSAFSLAGFTDFHMIDANRNVTIVTSPLLLRAGITNLVSPWGAAVEKIHHNRPGVFVAFNEPKIFDDPRPVPVFDAMPLLSAAVTQVVMDISQAWKDAGRH